MSLDFINLKKIMNGNINYILGEMVKKDKIFLIY